VITKDKAGFSPITVKTREGSAILFRLVLVNLATRRRGAAANSTAQSGEGNDDGGDTRPWWGYSQSPRLVVWGVGLPHYESQIPPISHHWLCASSRHCIGRPVALSFRLGAC
ncbi:hypothetical protein ALC57_01747, partial [Trachymyrmex cornetzi]